MRVRAVLGVLLHGRNPGDPGHLVRMLSVLVCECAWLGLVLRSQQPSDPLVWARGWRCALGFGFRGDPAVLACSHSSHRERRWGCIYGGRVGCYMVSLRETRRMKSVARAHGFSQCALARFLLSAHTTAQREWREGERFHREQTRDPDPEQLFGPELEQSWIQLCLRNATPSTLHSRKIPPPLTRGTPCTLHPRLSLCAG